MQATAQRSLVEQPETLATSERRQLIRYSFIYLIVVVCYLFYKTRSPDWDELYYMDFIYAIKKLILQHKFASILGLYHTAKFSGITSLPGYYVLVAILALLFPSDQSMRLVNVTFLFVLVVVFSKIQESLFGKDDFLKQLSFVFFPVTFTLSLLIYTDYAALFFVMISFYFELQRRYPLAALSLVLGFLVRQSIAPWIVLIPLICHSVQEPSSSTRGMLSILSASELKKRWLHLLSLLAFLAFVMINGGVAMGDKAAQATGKFSIGNIFVFYLFSCIFFLPGAIANIRKHVRGLLNSATAILALLAVFILFLFLYKPPVHSYNIWLQHRGTFFIRNNIVHWTMNNTSLKVAAFLCAVIGFLELNRTLRKDVASILTVAAAISLAPFNVIDIRYGVIPFAFYVILRNEQDAKLWKIQTIWLLLISMTWLWGVRMELFTPF